MFREVLFIVAAVEHSGSPSQSVLLHAHLCPHIISSFFDIEKWFKPRLLESFKVVSLTELQFKRYLNCIYSFRFAVNYFYNGCFFFA